MEGEDIASKENQITQIWREKIRATDTETLLTPQALLWYPSLLVSIPVDYYEDACISILPFEYLTILMRFECVWIVNGKNWAVV